MDFKELEDDFIHILTHGKKHNTYKFAFGRFLLDYANTKNEKDLEEFDQSTLIEVKYDEIAKYFLEYYWHQEFHSKIRQNAGDVRPLVISNMTNNFKQKNEKDKKSEKNYYMGHSFKKIKEQEPETVSTVENLIAKNCFEQVVPKFQNMVIGNKTKQKQTFYIPYEKENKIMIKPKALLFFKQHYFILLKSVILEWAKFLEKINKNTAKLISKIESEDNPRTSLKKYEAVLLPFFKNCFYCNRELAKVERIHVDHFIPRVYIREDDIWNFVLSCSDCNCKKSGSLAPEKFLDDIIERNSTYKLQIKGMEQSLKKLELGLGFENEIRGHYANAKEQKYMVLSNQDFKI